MRDKVNIKHVSLIKTKQVMQKENTNSMFEH